MATHILFMLLFLSICHIAAGKTCLITPTCYCDVKNKTQIRCRHVNDLSPIQLLLKQYPVIYKLTIFGTQLSTLPRKVFEGQTITIISFSCPLTSIPDDALTGIQNLEVVNFYSTLFASVPKALAIPTLKTVQMSDGMLLGLEDQLQNVTSAKDILLNNNKLSNVSAEAFLNIKYLESLNLSRNALTYLDPETFSQQVQLKIIDLSGNQLHAVDGCFMKLNPQTLLLYGNNLTNVDRAFHRGMWSMKWLDLGGNPNLNLRATVFEKVMKSLAVLGLADNRFSSVDPDLLRNFLTLYKIDLSRNNLTTIPSDFFSSSLHLNTIELSDNKLNSTDGWYPHSDKIEKMTAANMYALKFLKLDGNRLTSIKLNGAFKSVTHLDLSRNLISGIKRDDLENLTYVSILNMSHNPLSKLETDCFRHLHRVRTLDLSFSDLITLNHSVQNIGLDRLIVTSSPLRSLEGDELIGLKHLKGAFLWNNSLNSIYGAFKDHVSITALDIATNNLTTLTHDSFPPYKRNSPRLNRLWMEDNPWSCDCRLAWIVDWLAKPGSNLKDEPVCHSPPHLQGQKIRSLKLIDLELWKENCSTVCDCLCIPVGKNSFTNISCSGKGLNEIPSVFPSNAWEIDLHDNEITTIAEFSATHLNELRHVNLENNRLTEMRFSLPPTMETLLLAGNNIARFPLEEWGNTTLDIITLSRNPWICDCDTWKFRNWLALHNNSILDLEEVRCRSEEGVFLRNKVIVHLSRDDLCSIISVMNIILISVGGIILLAICLCCFWFRTSLAALCYSYGCSCVKKDGDHHNSFDACFLYSEKDENLALDVIAKGLEERLPMLKLCIPSPEVLSSSNDNIRSVITTCNKIIVILTREFLQDSLRMQIFKGNIACTYFSLKEYSKRIIIITKGDLPPPSEMEPTLAEVMKSSTNLRFGQCLFWEKLQYNLPKINNSWSEDQRNEEGDEARLGFPSDSYQNQ